MWELMNPRHFLCYRLEKNNTNVEYVGTYEPYILPLLQTGEEPDKCRIYWNLWHWYVSPALDRRGTIQMSNMLELMNLIWGLIYFPCFRRELNHTNVKYVGRYEPDTLPIFQTGEEPYILVCQICWNLWNRDTSPVSDLRGTTLMLNIFALVVVDTATSFPATLVFNHKCQICWNLWTWYRYPASDWRGPTQMSNLSKIINLIYFPCFRLERNHTMSNMFEVMNPRHFTCFRLERNHTNVKYVVTYESDTLPMLQTGVESYKCRMCWNLWTRCTSPASDWRGTIQMLHVFVHPNVSQNYDNYVF